MFKFELGENVQVSIAGKPGAIGRVITQCNNVDKSQCEYIVRYIDKDGIPQTFWAREDELTYRID